VSKVCSVSVDLDSLACYYRIHGLGTAPEELGALILERCLPRFLRLFGELGIRATFFTVAADVDTATGDSRARAGRRVLERCLEDGHEIGNHSYSHPYDLARWRRERAEAEVARAHEVLSSLGAEVVGFRAPGYDLSPAMLRALDDAGYLYDSSIFPAPGYYAAKLAVLGALRAMGRRSGAVVTNPRALLAPTRPYRPSLRSPWRRGHSRLVELPVAVTPALRMPAIGTSLLLAPEAVRRRLLDAVGREAFFNFELHGIDLADTEGDGIPGELVARQPDLRLAAEDKRSRLESMLRWLGESGFEFQTLARYAEGAQARL
jgi:peptidoglycan-N-acetylglucosamine deacetylase